MSDSRELPVNPRFGTPGVTVLPADGVAIVESGVAAWRGCVWQWPIRLRAALRLGRRQPDDDSRILLFGTEGVTDRVTYNHVLCSRQS
jgi:hypothetical protein